MQCAIPLIPTAFSSIIYSCSSNVISSSRKWIMFVSTTESGKKWWIILGVDNFWFRPLRLCEVITPSNLMMYITNLHMKTSCCHHWDFVQPPILFRFFMDIETPEMTFLTHQASEDKAVMIRENWSWWLCSTVFYVLTYYSSFPSLHTLHYVENFDRYKNVWTLKASLFCQKSLK